MIQNKVHKKTFDKKAWLDKRIKEGLFRAYSEGDIIDCIVLGHDRYGIIYKGRLKHSGTHVTVKTLLLSQNGQKDEMYKNLIKEVCRPSFFLFLFFTFYYLWKSKSNSACLLLQIS